jgi:hypothetical protein
MTPEQQAAYVIAMAACVNAEVAAMQAENAVAIAAGNVPVFRSQDFLDMTVRYGIHHNAVVGMFTGR